MENEAAEEAHGSGNDLEWARVASIRLFAFNSNLDELLYEVNDVIGTQRKYRGTMRMLEQAVDGPRCAWHSKENQKRGT